MLHWWPADPSRNSLHFLTRHSIQIYGDRSQGMGSEWGCRRAQNEVTAELKTTVASFRMMLLLSSERGGRIVENEVVTDFRVRFPPSSQQFAKLSLSITQPRFMHAGKTRLYTQIRISRRQIVSTMGISPPGMGIGSPNAHIDRHGPITDNPIPGLLKLFHAAGQS